MHEKRDMARMARSRFIMVFGALHFIVNSEAPALDRFNATQSTKTPDRSGASVLNIGIGRP